MVKLLDHSMPNPPDAYDADVFVRILRDIEMALTKIEFPVEVTGEEDSHGILWFSE